VAWNTVPTESFLTIVSWLPVITKTFQHGANMGRLYRKTADRNKWVSLTFV
jgi:hypothetical protein